MGGVYQTRDIYLRESVYQIIYGTSTSLLFLKFFSLSQKCFLFSTHQKRDFVDLAKVHPMKVWFGRNVNPELHRMMIGYVEVLCGFLLYAGPRSLKLASTVILLIVMAVVMQGLYWLAKPAIMFAPASLCTILLLCNFVNLLSEPSAKEKRKE